MAEDIFILIIITSPQLPGMQRSCYTNMLKYWMDPNAKTMISNTFSPTDQVILSIEFSSLCPIFPWRKKVNK